MENIGFQDLGRLVNDATNLVSQYKDKEALAVVTQIEQIAQQEKFPINIRISAHFCAGQICNMLDNYDRSINNFEGTLNILEKQGLTNYKDFQMLYVKLLLNLAFLYLRKGQYSVVQSLLNKVPNFKDKVTEMDQCVICAELYTLIKDYDSAEHSYKKALELAYELRYSRVNIYPKAANDLATFYIALSNYDKAIKYITESFIFLCVEETKDISLYDLGGIKYAFREKEKGNFENTRYALHEITDNLLRKIVNRQEIAPTLLIVFHCYMELEDLENAKQLLEEVKNNIKNIGSNMRLDIILNTFTALAYLYLNIQSHDKSRLYANMVSYFFDNIQEGNIFAFLLNNQTFSRLLILSNDFQGAERRLNIALEKVDLVLGNNHPLYADMLHQKALLHALKGEQELALSNIKNANNIYGENLEQAFAISSERQRLNIIKKSFNALHDYLSMVTTFSNISHSEKVEALEEIWSHKGIGIEVLAAQKDALLVEKYPNYRSQLVELEKIKSDISKQLLRFDTKYSLEAYGPLTSLIQRKEDLEKKLSGIIPEIRTRRISNATAHSIANILPTNSALVEIISINNNTFEHAVQDRAEESKSRIYLAFILQQNNESRQFKLDLVNLGNAESIDDAINTFLDALNCRDGGSDNRTVPSIPSEKVMVSGSQLRKLVFDPLQKCIGEKDIIISPDGNISKIPFQALPTGNNKEPLEFLFDHHKISYINCGRDLLRYSEYKNSNIPTNSPIVAGAPNFDYGLVITGKPKFSYGESRDLKKYVSYFFPLIHTKEEVIEIAKELNVEPIVGNNLDKEAIMRVHSPKILHMATHGFFLPNDSSISSVSPYLFPLISGNEERDELSNRLLLYEMENPLLRSGLALTGSNAFLKGKTKDSLKDNGILTAYEITGLDLYNTDLVSLSACDTGRGSIVNGEGVFGLQRAFFVSGAKTILMSLWSVDDKRTKDLMIAFYRNLKKGDSYSIALQKAQLSIRKAYANPYYWGAFILQGNPYSSCNSIGEIFSLAQ